MTSAARPESAAGSCGRKTTNSGAPTDTSRTPFVAASYRLTIINWLQIAV